MPCIMIFTNILPNVPFNLSLFWLGECATKNRKGVRMIVSCYFQAKLVPQLNTNTLFKIILILL